MALEKKTVNLEEFINYCLKKWKIFVVIIVVIISLFAGITKIVGEEITVPHSEEYLYYEKESAWLEKYLEESLLMKMNPTCIPEITLFIENVSDEKMLKDYVSSKKMWEEIDSAYNNDFFYELIVWDEAEEENVQLILRHITEEECTAFAEYIKYKIEKFDKAIAVTVGEIRIVQDENLQDEQLRWYDRIDYSKSLLLEAQAGYTIKVNLIAAIIAGGLCGGVLSITVVFVLFLSGKSKKNHSIEK